MALVGLERTMVVVELEWHEGMHCLNGQRLHDGRVSGHCDTPDHLGTGWQLSFKGDLEYL